MKLETKSRSLEVLRCQRLRHLYAPCVACSLAVILCRFHAYEHLENLFYLDCYFLYIFVEEQSLLQLHRSQARVALRFKGNFIAWRHAQHML